MKYNGSHCEKCSELFKDEDDVVVCPICGAPHHRSCWNETGSCAHTDEHANGYQWIAPEIPVSDQENNKPSEHPQNEFMLKNGESIVVCPRCGSMNCENDVYCMRCGAPLREQQNHGGAESFGNDFFGAQPDPNDFDNNNKERMYADFNRFGGLTPDSELDGIPVAEYSDYIGGKTPGKLIRKIAVMERFGKQVSWCWPAVIIGPVWFFWRKMKKEGIIFSLILIVLCSVSGILQINAPLERFYKETFDAFSQALSGTITREELQTRIEESSNIYEYAELTKEEARKAKLSSLFYYLAEPGLTLACALSSIYLYRKKCKKSILDIRLKCTNMDEYRNALRTEGGTSVGWGAFGALLFIAARLCLSYLPMLIVLF